MKILFNLSLVLLSLQLSLLFLVLILLTREVVLLLLVLGSGFLDSCSQLLLLSLELVVTILIVLLLLDETRILSKGEVALHFLNNPTRHLLQVLLVLADLELIGFDSRLLLELSTQLFGTGLQLARNSHNITLSLLKALLVSDAFELITLLDEPSILLLNVALLVHHLSDLLTHHLSHLFSHVVLQHFQIVQFFIHIIEDDPYLVRLQRRHLTHGDILRLYQ